MSKQAKKAAKRSREMREAQAKAERRRQSLIVGGVVLVVVAAIVGIVIAVQSSRTTAGGETPSGATADFGIVRGQEDAPVTVTIYEDFQCPVCKAFEDALGETLTTEVDKGSINVEYRPIAFLDDQSTTKYSSRALETAACVLDETGSDAFFAFHDLLFENQPAEGSAGLTDSALADLAAKAGADKAAVESCQSDDTFTGWVADATDQASKDGVTGTPTVLVDREKVTFTEGADPVQTLKDAIAAATP